MTDQTQRDWPRAVIMDLDGTLIDSASDIAHALNNSLSDQGIEPFALGEVRLMIGGGVPKLVERAFRARDLHGDARLDQAIEGMLTYYTAVPAERTQIYEGVVDVLTVLRAEGLKVGLCTNKPQHITEKVLEDLGLSAFFDAVVGGTSETPRKPDPLTLKLCVDQLDVSVDDCLLVGDSGADQGAAAALEMSVFLVEYGYSKIPVQELKPDAVLKTMPELLIHLFPEKSFKG